MISRMLNAWNWSHEVSIRREFCAADSAFRTLIGKLFEVRPVFSIHFDYERVRPEVASRRIEPPKTVRIGGRTRAEWMLAPHSDANPPVLNHVPAEWSHESPLHDLWPQPANHFEVCWRSVDLSFALIRCRRNGPLTDVVP